MPNESPTQLLDAATQASRQNLQQARLRRETSLQSYSLLSSLQGSPPHVPGETLVQGDGIEVHRRPSIAISRGQLLQILMFSGADRFGVTVTETDTGIAAFFTDHPVQGHQELRVDGTADSTDDEEERVEVLLMEMLEASIVRRKRDRAILDFDVSLSAQPEWD